MSINILIRAATLAAVLQFSGPVQASGTAHQMAGDLKLEQPWTRATPPKAPGGAYLTITNTGASGDRLVSVASPISGRSEIHEMKMDGGVMSMRPLADGITIMPGETVVLAPGGFHIMLMKLERPIREGEAVPITLRFEKAGEITLDFIAAPIGARKPQGDHSGSGG